MALHPPSVDDPRSQLAAQMFPIEWARVATKPGASKKRQQLRQRAERECRLREIRNTGASCASCWAYRLQPMSLDEQWICEMGSGGGAYQIANANDLCLSYGRREV